VTVRDRVLVAALLVIGLVAILGVVALAANLCPAPTADDPCADADRNRAIVVGTAAFAVVALMTGIAFLADYLTHNRIVYRGAWPRAVRRGLLTGLALAAIAGLRLVDALNPFSAIVVVAVAVAAEWLAVRRLDPT
jgi:hypothetical protein